MSPVCPGLLLLRDAIEDLAQARSPAVNEAAEVAVQAVALAAVRMFKVAAVTFASVKLVVAVPEIGPVAVTA